MSSPIHEIAKRLLAGEVICLWSDPDIYTMLEIPEFREQLNNGLNFLGVQIAQTTNESGYYLVMDPKVVDVTKRSRELFSEIIRDYRPTLKWVETLMKAISSDRPLMGGVSFRLVDLQKKVTDDPGIQQTLNQIKKAKGDGIRKQLESLVNELVKQGVLVVVDNNQEVYQFTAKMDLINEYLEFIVDHEVIQVEEPLEKQSSLI